MGSLTCPKCNSDDPYEVQRIPNTDPPLYEYRCGNCDAVAHKERPAEATLQLASSINTGTTQASELVAETELLAELETTTDPPSISIHGGYFSIPLDAVPNGTTVHVTMTYTLVVRPPDEAD